MYLGSIRLKTSRLPAISFLALLILWATYKCKEYNLGWEVTVIEYIVYICAGHPLAPVILSLNRSLKCKEYNLGWEVTVIECIVYICAGHPFPPVILSSQPVPPQVQRVQPGLGGDCH